jgi:hypothetical protein
VEAFHKGQRVASHVRSHEQYRYTTSSSHLPPNHREWLAKDPASLREWSVSAGPYTDALMQRLLERDPNFGNGVRSGQGLRRMAQKYGNERTEKACAVALKWGARSYKPVERILRMNREDHELARDGDDDETCTAIEHDQVRGPEYFDN